MKHREVQQMAKKTKGEILCCRKNERKNIADSVSGDFCRTAVKEYRAI